MKKTNDYYLLELENQEPLENVKNLLFSSDSANVSLALQMLQGGAGVNTKKGSEEYKLLMSARAYAMQYQYQSDYDKMLGGSGTVTIKNILATGKLYDILSSDLATEIGNSSINYPIVLQSLSNSENPVVKDICAQVKGELKTHDIATHVLATKLFLARLLLSVNFNHTVYRTKINYTTPNTIENLSWDDPYCDEAKTILSKLLDTMPRVTLDDVLSQDYGKKIHAITKTYNKTLGSSFGSGLVFVVDESLASVMNAIKGDCQQYASRHNIFSCENDLMGLLKYHPKEWQQYIAYCVSTFPVLNALKFSEKNDCNGSYYSTRLSKKNVKEFDKYFGGLISFLNDLDEKQGLDMLSFDNNDLVAWRNKHGLSHDLPQNNISSVSGSKESGEGEGKWKWNILSLNTLFDKDFGVEFLLVKHENGKIGAIVRS